jgi:hypothetical protein
MTKAELHEQSMTADYGGLIAGILQVLGVGLVCFSSEDAMELQQW